VGKKKIGTSFMFLHNLHASSSKSLQHSPEPNAVILLKEAAHSSEMLEQT
jgi:hypothetical protein